MESAIQPAGGSSAFPFSSGENEAVLRRHGGSLDLNRVGSSFSASTAPHHPLSESIFLTNLNQQQQQHTHPPRYRKQPTVDLPSVTVSATSATTVRNVSPSLTSKTSSAVELCGSTSIRQALMWNQPSQAMVHFCFFRLHLLLLLLCLSTLIV